MADGLVSGEQSGDWITVDQAAERFDACKLTLHRGRKAERFRSKRVERPGPRGARFLVLADDIARLRCSYPGCDRCAPGPSGRCGEHAARVKLPAELRRCRWCGELIGVIPGSKIAGGRGSFCCEAHEMRWLRANLPAFADAHLRGGEKALERYREVEGEIAAEGQLTTAQLAQATATSPTTIRARTGELFSGELRDLGGVKRLAYPPDAPQEYARNFVQGENFDKRRRTAFNVRVQIARRRGRRMAKLLAGGMDAGQAVREADQEICDSVDARWAFFRRYRGRKPTAAERNARWLDVVSPLAKEGADIAFISLLLWQTYPDDLPRQRPPGQRGPVYPAAPNDPESIHPDHRKNLIDVVRAAIGAELKVLQTSAK